MPSLNTARNYAKVASTIRGSKNKVKAVSKLKINNKTVGTKNAKRLCNAYNKGRKKIK